MKTCSGYFILFTVVLSIATGLFFDIFSVLIFFTAAPIVYMSALLKPIWLVSKRTAKKRTVLLNDFLSMVIW
jgi:hypothetical protein